jgi:glycine/D-amino acid oxidase-like deaminating enzyme
MSQSRLPSYGSIMPSTSSDTLASADLVVVGAGIAGVCTAFELRHRGFDVVLVEQRFPAFGASGRGPGAVWLQTRRAGDELELAKAGKAKYAEYIGVVGDIFDFRVNGGLFFFESEAQGVVLEQYVADRRAAGLQVEMLTRNAAHGISPLMPDTAIGAVFCADDAQLDAQSFVAAMSTACVREGVRTFENTSVLSTMRRGDTVTGVRTVRGDIHAPGVVWATGAWAKNLRAEGLPLEVTSARMGNVMTQPIEQRPSPVLHGPRGVSGCGALTDLAGYDPTLFSPPREGSEGTDASDSFEYDDFLAANRRGELYVGASIDGQGSLNPHISIRATTAMVSTLLERYDRYADFGITGLWAGLMTDTADHLPIVDCVDGVYANVGHSWGIASGPICGQIMAEIIAGEPNRFASALRAYRAGLGGLASMNAAPTNGRSLTPSRLVRTSKGARS